MYKKLSYLISFMLVLGLIGDASADLVVHWRLDEGSGTTAYDSSGNNNDGTLNGDPQWVAGHLGGALDFDGDGDYIETQRVVQDDFTLMAWIKADTPGISEGSQGYQGSGLIWSDVAGVANDFILAVLGTKLSFFCGNPDLSVNSDRDVVTGQWVHVVATRSAQQGEISIYIDGEHENTINHANSGPLNALPTIAVGGNVLDSRYYTGLIDEVRIYDHVLSEIEILGAMHGEVWPYAFGPDPADGATHADTWVTLGWKPGGHAVSHNVYLGDNFDDVNEGTGDTFRGNQSDTYFVAGFPGFHYPDGLVPGTTYYWRIDEVNDAEPNSPWKGDVWSFWIPPKTAYDPKPVDGVKFVDPDVELSWTAGFGTKLHTVYFGDNFDAVNTAVVGIPQATTAYSPGTLEPGKSYYWRIDEFDGVTTHKGDVWSFSTIPIIDITDPSLMGWWKLDEDMGTTAVDWSGHGNHGTFVGDPQWVPGYDGSALEFDGDDYVDTGYTENLANWTITAWVISPEAPSSAAPSGPVHRENNYQFNWNHSDATFRAAAALNVGGTWYAAKYEPLGANTWYHLAATYDGDVLRAYRDGLLITSNSAPSGTPNAEGNSLKLGKHAAAAQYFTGTVDNVRVYDRALTEEEIQQAMRGDPLVAWAPTPTNGSTVHIRDATPLSWSPGDEASQHDVYFGMDKGSIADADASDTTGIYRGRQSTTNYNPPEGVEWGGGPYYWRIDEYNTDTTISKGNVWSFTVADYITVDDFEAYNDLNPEVEGSNRIFLTWIDGYEQPTNGSQVGYTDPPFCEQSIVHSGGQSMPLFYNNSGPAYYSEATLPLTYPRDWTEEGVGILTLWFYGDPANANESMYVAVANATGPTAVVYHDNPDVVLLDDWTQWNINLEEISNQGVVLTNVDSIAIGFGNRNNPQLGGSGMVFIDDIRLYRPTTEPEPEAP